MGMRRILLVILSVLALPASASSPDAILEDYFTVIETTDFRNLTELFVPERMLDIKKLMVDVVKSESRGAMAFEKQVLGGTLSDREADKASADFYLGKIFRELASSAENVHFSLQNHTILGEVTENDDQVHIVARLKVVQSDKSADDIVVYSFTRVNDRWYMELPPILKNYLGLIEGSLKR
ncbi:MAG: hypothetical protein ACJAWK_001513 [Candidatus Azotimanducaceae bacterium]|jgi:hypothetical protein